MKQSLGHFAIFLVFFMTLHFANAQNGLVKVIPPSPNASALGRYGSEPIGLYTGTPGISIPIYEAKSGNLTLPISLNYHAGGIKVEEVATNVGIGWSLNAGGVITRTIRGKPDEFGWYPASQVGGSIESIMLNGTYQQQQQLIHDVNIGFRDGEPDLYYYNFGNYSGKFFLDQNGIGHSVPRVNLAITPSPWKIVAEDGTTYYFNKEETVSSQQCGSPSSESLNTVSWYLDKIESADKKNLITFEYDFVQYTLAMLVNETKYIRAGTAPDGGCMQNTHCYSDITSHTTHRLKKIDFQDGYVKFNYYNTRCDLVGDKSLDEIEIYTKDNQLVRKFNLAYGYFGDTSGQYPTPPGCNNSLVQEKSRLKLLSVAEENGAVKKPPYKFTYEESIPMPSRLSFAQDHWGFYNGKTSNPGLVATFVDINVNGAQVYVPGADRRADSTKNQVGILKKIQYPTGGETVFTYQTHIVDDPRIEADILTGQNLIMSMANQPIPPSPYNASGEMIIPSQGAFVQMNVTGLGAPLWQYCDIVNCYVIKDNNPTPFLQLSTGQGMSFWPQGTYTLRLETDCGAGALANLNVVIEASIPVISSTRVSGGLRIRSIEDIPADGGKKIKKTYRYQSETDPLKSTGVLINFPEYGHDLSVVKKVKEDCMDPFEYPIGTSCSYRVRNAYSNYPLATTAGSYVGYASVNVDYGPYELSKHTFTVYPDGPNFFPFAPIENFEWRRGFATSATDLVRQGNQYLKAREILNAPSGGPEFRIYGLKTGCGSLDLYNCFDLIEDCQGIVPTLYPVITEQFFAGQTKERLFNVDDQSKVVEKTIDYTYSPLHQQLTQEKTVTSRDNGTIREEAIKIRKYPLDYTFTGTPSGNDALGIKKLQDLHIVNVPVEEYLIKQDKNITTSALTNQRVVSGSIQTFKPDQPYLDKLLNLETSQSIPLGTFGSGSSIVSNAFTKNASYKPVVSFLSYDIDGNIVTQQKENDAAISYVWGYSNLYPIAEVTNSVLPNDIAHTSFEMESAGNWTIPGASVDAPDGFPLTGKKCYDLSAGTISKSLLTATTTYQLSFWYKTGASVTVNLNGGTQIDVVTYLGVNNWNLSVRKITGTTSISIQGTAPSGNVIDEVRLHPATSQMTTYTYSRLVGATSITDKNHRTTFYEYDLLGRLIFIKDDKRNIVKNFTYGYKQ